MNKQTELRIKNNFLKINNVSLTERNDEIISFLLELTKLYKSNSISSSELGYFILPLAQFKESVKDIDTFSEIITNAGMLELPESQIEEKGFNRQEILKKLLDLIPVILRKQS